MKNILILCVLIILPPSLFAGEGETTGLAFLKIGVDASSNAMAGAVSATSTGVSSIYWNPAGLAAGEKKEIAISHQEWLQGASNQFIGISFPSEKISYGLGLALSGVGDIELRDERPTEEPIGYFSSNSIMAAFSAAISRNDKTNYGITVKHIYEKIYVHSAYGFAFDAGMTRRFFDNKISIALQLKDVGFMNELNSESTPLPKRIVAGVAAKLMENSSYPVNTSLDAGKYLGSDGTFFRFGGSALVGNNLSLRGGYRHSTLESSGITAGIGLNIQKYIFDYAYLPFDNELGSTHQMTLRIKF